MKEEKDLRKLRETSILHMQDVVKRYGAQTVLEDIDFSLKPHELCTVVGPSGCGKSTLLRMILGAEFPCEGEIYIDHEQVNFPDATRGIVYQQYSLLPHLNVIDNVTLGPRLQAGIFASKAKKRDIIAAGMYFLGQVKLDDRALKFPKELSGGMRQRVALAQTLIMKPKILLMDEPFGALDPGTRESMQVFLLELWEKFKMTILFITHDLEEAAYLGTRLIGLSQFYKVTDKENGKKHGARILLDEQLSSMALSTKTKATKEIGEFIQHVRSKIFDPKYVRSVTEFDLKHPDSFQTFSESDIKEMNGK